ncbi:MAG: SRPBCC domain-containing protein [Chloroflexota bacterium]
MSTSTNGKASTIKETFSRETSVSIQIEASPAIVWGLLTNASDAARWNSTIVSLEGNIALGQTVKLVSTLDESRTFNLTVKEFEPEKRLVWGDRQGSRVYSITPQGSGVIFSMNEKIGGFLFPLFSRFIPPFDESFEQFAADLKREAERQAG